MNVSEHRPARAVRPRGPRVAILVGMAALAAGITLLLPPLAQPAYYHDFADGRTILGVPHFLNVVSNVPFALVGAFGLWFLARGAGAGRRGTEPLLGPADRWTFGVMFAGVLLTAFGSATYHLRPDDAGLFWDRLPMSVAFMGFLAGMISERISSKAGAILLGPLVVLGMASVLWWRLTGSRGAGDLRFYVLVQAFPLAALPYVALALPARYLPARGLLVALGWYALAKGLELLDGWVYGLGHVVSGHTLKHLAAAAGTWWVLWAIVRHARRPRP